MCVQSMSNPDASKDFKRQTWGAPWPQSQLSSLTWKTSPGATLPTGHDASQLLHYTHNTVGTDTLRQHRALRVNWSWPQELFQSSSQSLPQMPHGERCYQLPHDSSGHAMRIGLCCSSGLSSRSPRSWVIFHWE